jgi:hypothetical protein
LTDSLIPITDFFASQKALFGDVSLLNSACISGRELRFVNEVIAVMLEELAAPRQRNGIVLGRSRTRVSRLNFCAWKVAAMMCAVFGLARRDERLQPKSTKVDPPAKSIPLPSPGRRFCRPKDADHTPDSNLDGPDPLAVNHFLSLPIQMFAFQHLCESRKLDVERFWSRSACRVMRVAEAH